MSDHLEFFYECVDDYTYSDDPEVQKKAMQAERALHRLEKLLDELEGLPEPKMQLG